MVIKDVEKHERVLYVAISREELEGIIRRAVAVETGIPAEALRSHGRVEIEENKEGSPSYTSGYRATVRATLPLSG